MTGNPNIPLLVFAICQSVGGAMLTMVPFVQKLSRDTTRGRKMSNIRLIEEDRKSMLVRHCSAETFKPKEPTMCVENGRLAVPKLSPSRSLSGSIKS